MKITLVAVFTLFLITSLGIAQEASPSSTAPTRNQVLQFMDLMQTRVRLVQIMDGVAKQARLGAEHSFKLQVPDPSQEQMAKVDALAESILKDLPIDEMLEAMVPIYQKHLTKADLDGIIAFYGSPLGQKLMKETPAMMSEAMEAGGAIGRQRMDTMNQRLNEQIAQLAETEGKKTGAPKAQPAKN